MGVSLHSGEASRLSSYLFTVRRFVVRGGGKFRFLECFVRGAGVTDEAGVSFIGVWCLYAEGRRRIIFNGFKG